MPRKTRNIHLVETALLTPKVYLQPPVPVVPVTGNGKFDGTFREDLDDTARIGMIKAQYQADSALMTQRCWQQLCCAGLLVGAAAASGGGR